MITWAKDKETSMQDDPFYSHRVYNNGVYGEKEISVLLRMRKNCARVKVILS